MNDKCKTTFQNLIKDVLAFDPTFGPETFGANPENGDLLCHGS